MRKLSILIFLVIAGTFILSAQSQEERLKALRNDIESGTYPNIDAIIVEHNGKQLVEEYYHEFDADTPHDTRSSFKSITSLLTGIAIDKGLLTLDDTLLQFFPELEGKPQASITVQSLLEMRSGFDCEEFYGSGPDCENDMWDTEDWVAFCLSRPVKDDPGMNWAYSSNEPMIVGEVITRASGMSVVDFARTYLFEPLDIHHYRWTLSPKDQGMTAGSFFMLPLDMMKIIRLVDQKGEWDGKQIVSEAWVERSTTCDIDIDFSFTRFSKMRNARYFSSYYGFYWYQERIVFGDIDTKVLFASGNGGQYMMRLPEYDMLIVFTGSNYGNWRGKLPFEILMRYLIPLVEASAGAED